jgi:heat-inducible transcriptional repressor
MQSDTSPLNVEKLNYRQRQVLYAAVTEYIASGQAVSSRTLAKRYGLGLSAASIRNVLADLEELGCLTQPHTSAGRVPTDIGFRVFVDALMRGPALRAKEESEVTARLRRVYDGRQGGDFISESGKVLASLTGAAAVITPPRAHDEVLQQMRYIALNSTQLLVILIMRSGSVQNRVVTTSTPVQDSELERIHNYLEARVKNRTLEELHAMLTDEMALDHGEYRALCAQTIDMIDATLDSPSSKPQLVIEGQGELLDRPEFSDAEKLRGLIRTLEEKERIAELLHRTLTAKGVQVVIGSETQLGSDTELSVICANYGSQNSSGGTVGVIAPRRIDYGKVVPLVDLTARVMSDLLDPDATDE